MPGTHRGTPISLIPPSMRTFPCRNRSLRALSVQNRPPCVTRWVQLHVPNIGLSIRPPQGTGAAQRAPFE
jgi:hypothetical protein